MNVPAKQFRLVFLVAGLVFLFITKAGSDSNLFYITSSSVKFRSEAAQEIISAESDKMQGIVDVSRRTFAFSVLCGTFHGFNSSLQREHFNENYMETEKYPTSLFKGKIIEEVDFTKPGIYDVRAKGTIMVHGITQERIIRSKITVKQGWLEVESSFLVLLSDHGIRVPKVVHEKIAEEIKVEIKARLERQ